MSIALKVSDLDQEIEAAFASRARRTAALLVKRRARDYARQPRMLGIIAPGLETANGAVMIATARELLAIERATLRRFAGFGGAVQGINSRAVLLLGRALRRAGR